KHEQLFFQAKDGIRDFHVTGVQSCALPILALPDGRLVLVFNPTTRGRTPLWLRVSDDRGVTWTDPLVLEDGEGEYSYPAVIATGEDTLHLTYTYRRTHIVHAEVKVF